MFEHYSMVESHSSREREVLGVSSDSHSDGGLFEGGVNVGQFKFFRVDGPVALVHLVLPDFVIVSDDLPEERVEVLIVGWVHGVAPDF